MGAQEPDRPGQLLAAGPAGQMSERAGWSAPGIQVLVLGIAALLAGIGLLLAGLAVGGSAGRIALIVVAVLVLIGGHLALSGLTPVVAGQARVVQLFGRYPHNMGKVFDGINESLASWIAAQPVWFVATAPLACDGHINLSPRGHDCLSILGEHRVGWVDYTGSGVETIAHLRENGRICLMFASFDRRPRIVRLHGRGTIALPGDPAFDEVTSLHPDHPSTRAVITVDVTRVSDSCGYGVPMMEMVGERDLLRLWAEKKGPEGVADYRLEKNGTSIDGLPALEPAHTTSPVR